MGEVTEIRRLTVLIVDDYPVVRVGLKALLAQYDTLEAQSAAEAIDIFRENHQIIDAIVLDYSLELQGVETAREILSKHPNARIVLFIGMEGGHVVSAAIRHGIKGVASKADTVECLKSAVSAVANNQMYLSRYSSQVLMQQMHRGVEALMGPTKPLSAREGEVLRLIAQGTASNKEIAWHLKTKISTIKTIRQRIYRKLDVSDVSELLAAANRFRLLPK
jgi:DNA-binding NarL/FixJ family response regulator